MRAAAGAAGDAPRPGRLRSLAGRLRDRQRRRGYLFAIAGGLAGALAFEPVGLRLLAPLAPTLAFLALRHAPTAGGGFRRLLLFGWIFQFGAVHWLTKIGDYAPVPILATFGIGLLALYMALYLAAGGWALRRWAWPAGPGWQYVLFACVWLLAEWLRTLGRLAVPLGQLGHTWAVWPLAIQPAQFLGELGVTMEILWLGGLIFLWGAVVRARRAGTPAAAGAPNPAPAAIWSVFFLVWIAAAGLLYAGWDARLRTFAEQPQARPVRVAMLQPNIEQQVKFAAYAYPHADVQKLLQEAMTILPEAMLAGLDRPQWDAMLSHIATAYPPQGDAYVRDYVALVDAITALQDDVPTTAGAPLEADLVILPETAILSYDLPGDSLLAARVGRMAVRAGAQILFGSGRMEGGDEFFNSAFLMQADGRLADVAYDKIRLVPFGESLPYFDLIPGFQENIVGIGSFSEGHAWQLFDLRPPSPSPEAASDEPLRFGVLICFESTFSSMARRFVREGAHFLAVITNDAWYGMSAGAATHHNLSLLRAVETRRHVLRCANTGISSVIDPLGRIVATLPLGEAGFVRATIVPRTDYGTTMFTRMGNTWLVLPALAIVTAIARRRRTR